MEEVRGGEAYNKILERMVAQERHMAQLERLQSNQNAGESSCLSLILKYSLTYYIYQILPYKHLTPVG